MIGMRGIIFIEILLACVAWSSGVVAQPLAECRQDYVPLLQHQVPDISLIQPGATLYLRETYLRQAQTGTYQEFPAELRYYLKVRPATKQEIRKGRIKGNPDYRLGQDGHVYIDVPVDAGYHFFEASDSFEGSYHIEWRRQQMVLPIGIKPIDIQPYTGDTFRVLARETDYLLLKVADRRIAFYRGFPPMDDVFDTEDSWKHLQYRRKAAESWLGHEMFIWSGDEAELPPHSYPTDWIWSKRHATPRILQSVSGIGPGQITFDVAGQISPLTLTRTSEIELYDAGCVEQYKHAYLDSLRQKFSRQEVELEAFASYPVERWANNADLRRHLSGRFIPIDWSGDSLTYRHLLHPAHSGQPYVYAQVDHEGKCRLISHFVSDDGLYHTRLRVFVGDDSLDTERVPTIDQKSQRRYRGQQVIEEVTFLQAPEIIQAIALAGNQPVRIRFIAGGDYYQEIRLPAIHRSLIRDTWMWAQILASSDKADDLR